MCESEPQQHFKTTLKKTTFMTRALTFVNIVRLYDGHEPSTRRLPSMEEVRMFKSDYGVSPEVCVVLLRKLRLVNCRPDPKHILWALCFLKTYATETFLTKKFRTTRKHSESIIGRSLARSRLYYRT